MQVLLRLSKSARCVLLGYVTDSGFQLRNQRIEENCIFFIPVLVVLSLSLLEATDDLLFNRLHLLSDGEVVVKFVLDIPSIGKLGEELVKEINQTIAAVAELHDTVLAEAAPVLLAKVPELLFHVLFFRC